jgi:hypothetical protein
MEDIAIVRLVFNDAIQVAVARKVDEILASDLRVAVGSQSSARQGAFGCNRKDDNRAGAADASDLMKPGMAVSFPQMREDVVRHDAVNQAGRQIQWRRSRLDKKSS